MSGEKKSLNEWRMLKGLTVLELARVSGVGRVIQGYLYEGKSPKVGVAQRLAETLGIDLHQVEWGKVDHPGDERADVPPMPRSPKFNHREGTPIISDEQMKIAVQWAAAGRSKREVTEAMGVSRPTFLEALKRYEAVHGPVLFKNSRVIKPETQSEKRVSSKAKKGGATGAGEIKPKGARRGTSKDTL